MMSFARRENTRTYSEHENNGRNNCVSNSYMPPLSAHRRATEIDLLPEKWTI